MAEQISQEVWTALQFMRPEDRAEYVFKTALEKAPTLLHATARQPIGPRRFRQAVNPLNEFLYDIGSRIGLVVTKVETCNVTGKDLFEVTITTVRENDAKAEHTMKFTVSDTAEAILREQFKVETMNPLDFVGPVKKAQTIKVKVKK